jgi:exodeoxyribonuclease X
VTILAVTDTETSGFEDHDQIVELAVGWIDTDRPKFWCAESWLVIPEVPISSSARAVHHITDDILHQSLAEWLTSFKKHRRPDGPMVGPPSDGSPRPDVIVAHNAAFDLRLLRQSRVPLPTERVICTYRCSSAIWPEAENHKLQSLRYELDLKFDEPAGLVAHRALYDVYTCRALLNKMLETFTVEELEKMTREPILLSSVRFGKHRGSRWRDLDSGYLQWILTKDFDADARHTATHWLRERGKLR